MLETMRNQAQSWIAKVILLGIALSFALWGVGDYFLGSQVEYVAEVDGKSIADREYREAYERQINGYRAMMGRNLSKEMIKQLGLKSETLQTLINRRLLADEAYELGLITSEAVLVSSVRSNPSFQSAGNFNPQAYRIITRNMGFRTTMDYEEEMRLNLMVDALQKAIFTSVRVSDSEIRDSFDREYEQRVIAAIMIDPDSLQDDITINDSEARTWYDEHKTQYQSDEKVVLHAVVINPQAMKDEITISEGDIASAYEQQKDTFTTPEERHARQILLRVATQADDADREKVEQKMKAIQLRLEAGEDFAALAKESSDDVNAEDGGDLGYVQSGMLQPEVDEALFAMESGSTSDIITASNGLYLLKLEAIEPAGLKSLLDVQDKIADTLRVSRAQNEAYNLSQDLENALGMESSLKAAAEQAGMEIVQIEAVSRSEALADPLLGSSNELRKEAFRSQPGDIVNISELEDGRFVALEVVSHLPSADLPFKDVAASVYADAKAAKATEKAQSIAESILAKSNENTGLTPDEVAQEAGQAKFISKPIKRSGVGDDSTWLTQAVVDSAFKGQSKQWLPEAINTSRGLALIYVQEINKASDEDFANEKDSIKIESVRNKGAVRFARWMATIRDQHDIIIYQNVLDQI